jgi:neutral ceramidase
MCATLWAGSAAVDITPPLEVGFLRSAVQGEWEPFRAVRQPLMARALILESEGERWAWVSADLLGFSSAAFGPWTDFKEKICRAASSVVSPPNLLLVATHTHSAPETLGLTALPRTATFARWRAALVEQLGRALHEAARGLSPRQLGLARSELKGFSIYRRIREPHGIVLSTFADTALVRRQADKPQDDSVWVAAFLDEVGVPREVVVNATCHPVYEMCLPRVSPDYPGAMYVELQRLNVPAASLFFNGAAGNINPLFVSGGPQRAMAHGQRLADTVAAALQRLTLVPARPFLLRQRRLQLPCRRNAGWQDGREWVEAELVLARMGSALFLFLPGEPFVETGLACRDQSPLAWTAVIGYAGESIGYIPTEQAFEEGGYEVGPGRWSYLARGAEPAIRAAVSELFRDTGA